jgi:hypothetical protein
MGRMNPPEIPAGYTGANAFAVADQFREAQRKRFMDCGREAQRLRDLAEQWLARFPEFADGDGRPCPFAIETALDLRRRHGSAVNRGMVLVAWQRRMTLMNQGEAA